MIELSKENEKIPAKYKWKLPDVIPLIPIIGVNRCLPILHISKRIIHIYSTEKTIHPFANGYMLNPFLRINNVFRTQFQRLLGCSLSIETMKITKVF